MNRYLYFALISLRLKFLILKYLSPVGSMITCWVTTFWFLKNIKHQNHADFMNQKVVGQTFIIEPTDDKYFNNATQTQSLSNFKKIHF